MAGVVMEIQNLVWNRTMLSGRRESDGRDDGPSIVKPGLRTDTRNVPVDAANTLDTEKLSDWQNSLIKVYFT